MPMRSRQEPDRPAIRRQADAAEDLREPRGLRRDDQVAGQRDAPADAHGRAAHRGDHRLLGRVQRAQEAVAAALHLLAFGAQPAALHAADIGAGAEGAPLAGDDDRAHLVVEPQLLRVCSRNCARISPVSAFSFSGRFSTTFATAPSMIRSTDIAILPFSCVHPSVLTPHGQGGTVTPIERPRGAEHGAPVRRHSHHRHHARAGRSVRRLSTRPDGRRRDQGGAPGRSRPKPRFRQRQRAEPRQHGHRLPDPGLQQARHHAESEDASRGARF